MHKATIFMTTWLCRFGTYHCDLHDAERSFVQAIGNFSDLQRPKGSVLFHHLDDNHAHCHGDEELCAITVDGPVASGW